MRPPWSFAALLALSSCAHPATTPHSQAPTQTASRRAHTHGGPRGAALAAAATRAERCLGHDEGVGIEGSFEGDSGHFNVIRVVGLATPEEERCVTAAFEEAHVEPFTAVAPEVNWFVTAPGVSAEARDALHYAVYGYAHGSDDDDDAPRGAIDASAVTAMIREEDPAIQQCYQGERARNPALAGAVRVRMRIALDGRIDRASSEEPPELRAVGACVVARLRELTWPRPHRASVTFLLPFAFRP